MLHKKYAPRIFGQNQGCASPATEVLPPAFWAKERYQARREKCGVPADLAFQTHSELAWDMIQTLHEMQVLPFRWVIGDEQFGNNPTLLDRITSADLYYLAEVPHDTLVWQTRPATAVAPPSGQKGRPSQRPRLLPDAPTPLRVDAVAADPSLRWQ